MKKLLYSFLVFGPMLLLACSGVNCENVDVPRFRKFGAEPQVFINENAMFTLSPVKTHRPMGEIRWQLPNGEMVVDTSITIGPMRPELSGSYTMSVYMEDCWVSRSIIVNRKSLKADCDLTRGFLTVVDSADSVRIPIKSVYQSTYAGFIRYFLGFGGDDRLLLLSFKDIPEPDEYTLQRHIIDIDNASDMTMYCDFGLLLDYSPISRSPVFLRMENGKRIISFCNLEFRNIHRGDIWRLYGEFVLEE